MRRSDHLHKIIRAVGYPCFHSVYRIDVQGRENLLPDGPAIVAAKHQFWTDIPIVGLALWKPAYYVAKQELFVYPFVREFLNGLGGIPLDRANPMKTRKSFRLIEDLLGRREWIVLFPEGTYYPYSMGAGKHRLIELILRFQDRRTGGGGIPFYPMGIQYSKSGVRPPVRVRIGPPLYRGEGADAEEFTRQIMAGIAELSGLGPAP
ncbi:MAG TPA: lysophospholipid acyltransferase family protein [Thermodesulfobacteriota bacterium]|nr:lysophospholipid acyltransferase family protein [Thermodesulfobacteriota bacterium]